MSFIEKVKEFIKNQKLLSYGDTVVIGVSGGPDSIALLNILHALKPQIGLRLIVAHFNHQLRKDAAKDQKFVENLARRLHLPYVTEEWKRKKSTLKKGSLEELARKQRLKFLMRTAKKEKTKIIALAHHQDDLAETVLMRILRGSGLKGLRAILPKKEMEGFNIIRPLLSVKRKEIESYLKNQKKIFRIDPTNKKLYFFRNKIRHELIPLLEKKYQKNIKSILANLAYNTAIDYNYLNDLTEKKFKKTAQFSTKRSLIRFKRSLFNHYPDALKRMLIRYAIEQLKGDTNRLTFNHMKAIENMFSFAHLDAMVHLPAGILVTKEKSYLTISLKK